jgi:DHA2 family multidrug resistance protein
MNGSAQGPARKVPLRDWIAVLGAILGAFMAVLDIQITNASLKYIQGGLAASLDEGTWISTGYLVAEIVTIPLTGYLGGVFGVRRYVVTNAALFVIFSMLCGMATNFVEMVLFRAAQGFTGGVMIPMALTTVNLKLPPEKRSIGMALFGITATLGPAIGPTIGGYLTDNFGWPYIFYINLVPGLLLIAMIWYGMDPEPMRLDRLLRGDWFGILAMAIGLGSLEVVLEEGERKDWFGNPMIRNLAIIATIFTLLFIVIELLRKEPFINLRLLKQRTLGSSCVIGLSLGLALYGSVYIIPVYLGQVQGYDAAQIGHVIMWMGLPQLLVFPFVPLLMKRIDARILLAFGLIVFAISNFMNVDMTHDTAEPQLRWAMLVRALGQPFVITTITQMAVSGVSREDTAGASSLFNVMRNLGGSIGIAMLQTFTTWREHFHFDVVSERITQNDLQLQERIELIAQQMLPHAGNLAHATDMAMGQLQAVVRREAYVMAYSDCFFIMGAVLLASVVGVFFMRKPHPGHGP